MKAKRTLLCLCMLAVLCMALPAQADPVTDMLVEYGLTAPEAIAFLALYTGAGQPVTEESLKTLLQEFMAEGGGEIPGLTQDGVYTDPNGFALKVPKDWVLQPNQIGPVVILTGPADETGMLPIISVLATAQAKDGVMDKTEEEIKASLGASLPNFQFIALDEFDYNGTKARELVVMYGAEEDAMMMQYETYFEANGRVYLVTMTTRAEEAVHDRTLETYDAFLADFKTHTDQGNG